MKKIKGKAKKPRNPVAKALGKSRSVTMKNKKDLLMQKGGNTQDAADENYSY